METLAANVFVGVEEVTANRDARVLRQRDMLVKGEGAVVSFTVNTPGPVKDTHDARVIFHAGLEAVAKRAAALGWNILETQIVTPVTGPEALLRIAIPGTSADAPVIVKMSTVTIEETHALGRLFDFDILSPEGSPISRTAQGVSSRSCFVCGQRAVICARSRAHPLEELLACISRMVADYTAGLPDPTHTPSGTVEPPRS